MMTQQQQLPFHLDEITLPSSVDTTLRLFSGPSETPPINFAAKNQKETNINIINIPSDFLGLAIDPSRNYQQETIETQNEFLDAKKDHVLGSVRKSRSINRRRPRITALSPTPIRSYHPSYGYKVYDHAVLGGTTNDAASTSSSSSKRSNQETSSDPPKKRERRRTTKADYDEDETASPEIPCSQLLATIGPETRPVFLYKKKLVEWDMDKGQNRLLVNRKEKLMSFLTEEERRAVNNADGAGLDLTAVDSVGTEFKMRCKIWGSIGKVVIKTSWHKMVLANGAKVGHQVLLWGYRKDDGKFRLAVEFRDQ